MRSLLLALCLSLVAAGAAGAAPSFNGYTGLLLVPNADALDQDEFNLAAFSTDITPRTDVFSFQYGVGTRLEAGAARIHAKGSDRETVLMAKYAITPETERKAGVAVGVYDPFDEIEATAYVSASKTWGRNLRVFEKEITSVRGTVGFGGGSLDGFYLGLSGALGERLLLLAELVHTQRSDTHDFNAGARLNIGQGLRLHGALFDNLSDFGFGLSYNKMR